MSDAVEGTLKARLEKEIKGDVLFDRFSRGRYSTDASFYQIEPVGVVVPRTEDDLQAIVTLAGEEEIPLLPRGAGTSQSGQTVGRALVIDFSKYLNNLIQINVNESRCMVQPGIVLDELNLALQGTGLWFPVDISTSSRATIGGMAGNNSCGTRSLRYGIMRNNVLAIDAILPNGTKARFGEVSTVNDCVNMPSEVQRLLEGLLKLGKREAKHIRKVFPDILRRVGGYNIDALLDNGVPINLAELLIGSEGTLALSTSIDLKLAPLPKNKALGVCHFPTFRSAMEAAQHIVKLGPAAVEVVDRTLIELARDIRMFGKTIDRFVKGEPAALLLTEFAEDNQVENISKLKQLDELMGDLGHPHSVVEAIGSDFQREIWEVRKSGLNIMMSMKGEGKPVSFIEDCAVPLEHLADYTERLTDIFGKYGTEGTWYAHASVGCLHVRPVLNLKLEEDIKKMRAIAEEAFELVRTYKGTHSGEHGDGLVRSEFHSSMYGEHIVEIFEEVKYRFDPEGRMNPGKIVHSEPMDNRRNFRYAHDYHVPEIKTALDWSSYTGSGGGFQGAIEMCNNNGACRKRDAQVMCPSYRVTGNEKDVTRGRANTLRLALSGQLGKGALSSTDMRETMKLCVSCKACKLECPLGVDMAKMKIEVLHAMAQETGIGWHERLVAYLPRYAPLAAKLSWAMNLRDKMPSLARASEKFLEFSEKRPLPQWRYRPFKAFAPVGPEGGPEVALFADSFNRYFEPENLYAAARLLMHAGYRVHCLEPSSGRRPLCCGRTFLSAGLVDQARREAERVHIAASPFIDRKVPIIGLEPSCLLSFRDEFLSLLPGTAGKNLSERAFLLEEFLYAESEAKRLKLKLKPMPQKALLHGHCHQKAHLSMGAVEGALQLIPELEVEVVSSSCCGMAGTFGYHRETYDISVAMGELSLLPAIRTASENTIILADGFSCRHQIKDGGDRTARHVVQALCDALM